MLDASHEQFMQNILSNSKNLAWARSSAWSERLFQIHSNKIGFEGVAFNQEARGSNPPGPIHFDFQFLGKALEEYKGEL